METGLRERKQQVVRDALHHASIELFTKKGFDSTTVDEIAEAAGVSRRSFFRYFESKADLLAESVLNYGAALGECVRTCPPDLSVYQVLEETVRSGVKHAAKQELLTRKTVEIAIASISARQAYQSRMMEVEDSLTDAFAARFKGASKAQINPRLLAGITLAIVNATISSWFSGDYKDLPTSAKQVFKGLSHTVCGTTEESHEGRSTPTGRRLSNGAARSKSS